MRLGRSRRRSRRKTVASCLAHLLVASLCVAGSGTVLKPAFGLLVAAGGAATRHLSTLSTTSNVRLVQRLGDERGGGGLEAVRVEPKAGAGGPGAARPLGRGSVRAGPLAVESSPAGGERQAVRGAGDGVGRHTGRGRVAAWPADIVYLGHGWSCTVAALE